MSPQKDVDRKFRETDQGLVKTGGGQAPESAEETLIRPSPDVSELSAEDETLQKMDSTPENQAETLQVDRRPVAVEARSSNTCSAGHCGVGEYFGEYEILAVIAKGGMGVVYKARQRKLNRICALKMILTGQFADSTEVDRFYAEAEAAANLRHPNIVGVYEIGEAQGQHFFSMEYIEGGSLAIQDQENPLEPKRAADYTKKIALAMQFAHDRGILHRDLKPSNVLLDANDEPLITDFGLAKKVDGGSQLTMTGMVVGTPSYMPPEQARGDTANIGPAADIYSTGAILYQLITGIPPFRGSTPFETVRRVLEAEPVAPRVVNPGIPRDLETICLKALQKAPESRYASEQELADELGRFLAGEPIRARRIGAAARASRWCKRNPVVASLSAAAVTFLMAALVATTIGYISTSAALKESDESFRQARAAVDELFTRVSEDTLLNQPGMQPLRRDLLKRALNYYQRFLEQRGDDAAVRDELGNTFFRIGLITEELEAPIDALTWYEKALSTQYELLEEAPHDHEVLKDIGDIRNAIGRVYHNSHELDKALVEYGRAEDVRRQLVELQPTATEPLRLWTNSLMNLAVIKRERLDFEAARLEMETAQRHRARQLARDPSAINLRRDYAKGFYNLGVLESSMGRPGDAEARFRDAQNQFANLLADDPDELTHQWSLATCHRLIADIKTSLLPAAAPDAKAELQILALDSYRASEKLLKQLALRNPDVLEYQTSLAGVNLNLGSLYQSANDNAAALQAYKSAHGILQELAEQRCDVPRIRRDLAVAKRALAIQRAKAGQLAEAADLLTASCHLFEELVQDVPQNEPEYSPHLETTRQVLDRIRQLQAARAVQRDTNSRSDGE